MTGEARWIWYPGDFEIHQGMLQNFLREERGMGWPAYWHLDDCRRNLIFKRTYDLMTPTSFRVLGKGLGHVVANGTKHPLGTVIKAGPGRLDVEVAIGNPQGLPAIYVEGDVVRSDAGWMADDFVTAVPAGSSPLYTRPDQDPEVVEYVSELVEPVAVEAVDGGALFDFGRMVYGMPEVQGTAFADGATVELQFGESRAEALDAEWCYYSEKGFSPDVATRRRAFRYLFVPGVEPACIDMVARHLSFPIEVRASFSCDDELLNRIFDVAARTFLLCSELFFTDGIKRDRWIWAGDAYQSYLVNRYLMFDTQIDKRTQRALRGHAPQRQQINTITDYTMLWLIANVNEYAMDADAGFLAEMWPKMEDTMRFMQTRRDADGLVCGRERDWIFVDWCDMDKEGPVCAEQILFWRCCGAMAQAARATGCDAAPWEAEAARMRELILARYWDEELGAFIDGFVSGARHVTRQTNILAIFFDFVDGERARRVMEGVVLSRDLPPVTTPYFRFYELDVLARTGHLAEVLEQIRAYWGGMLEEGAVTFWEQYDPAVEGAEHFSMYGDPFGKSLCHAWAAAPIYLLGRYFLGVRPLEPGYGTFEVAPRTEFFKSLECTVPVAGGSVHITYQDGTLDVTTNRPDAMRTRGEGR